MSTNDRQYLKFYGVSLDDWTETFGTFSNTHKLMLREYRSDAVSYDDSSEASLTNSFLYPFDIERKYYLEGTAEGEFTLAASGCTSTVTSYRVTICKTYKSAAVPDAELATTQWRTVNFELSWDAVNSIGQERVMPFYIHVSPEQQLTEGQRLYLKIEVNCNSCTRLMHTNDPEWTDIWIDIPFKGI